MNYADPKLKDALQPGAARCPAITPQEIIAGDAVAAPEWVRTQSYAFLGDEDIPADRYTKASFAEAEQDRMWPRTWQFACRDEHIPEVGDYCVYDVGAHSLIVTRVGPDDIRAYFNSCLHRGTKLRHSGTEGTATEFKCSFHGWSWNVDGSCKTVLCDWDFPHAQKADLSLPQARVATLGGFIFVNMDPGAPNLEDYIGPEALAHIKAWKLEDRYVYCHVKKRIPANWKLNQEAFHEAYHVLATHPQVSPSNADANSQYDTYGDHVNRFISPLGVVSPHLAGKVTEQDVFEQFVIGDPSALAGGTRKLAEGETARAAMARLFRTTFEEANHVDLSNVSDSELLDCFSYSIYPNMFVFPGVSLPMVYRFLPDRNDHRKSTMEVLFLRPKPADGSYFETAEMQVLRDDQSFTEAKGMDPGFGAILDQDTDNLLLQQEGLEAASKKSLTLGNYQEIRIRHCERALDRYMAMPPLETDWREQQKCGRR